MVPIVTALDGIPLPTWFYAINILTNSISKPTLLHQEHLYSDIKETWDLFPKDRDGAITHETLRSILSDQGIEIEKEDLEEVFKLMDKNKDGKLDLKDFAQYQDC